MPEPADSPDGAPPDEPETRDVETAVEPEEEDGLRHVHLSIRRSLPDRRLDKYLSGRLGRGVSRTSLQQYIHEGNVTVNGRSVRPSYKIREGDEIDLVLPVVRPRQIPPESIPLDIVYEDEDLLAINKQADLIIHPARGNWTGTLVNGLAYYFRMKWGQDGEQHEDIGDLPTAGEVFRPGIVHRLDRDTTGILLVAKTDLALWRLGRQFELRHIHKTYTAIVHGLVELNEDVIDMPIGKHPKIRDKYAVHRGTGRPYASTTKNAVTRYKVLQRLPNVGGSRASFTLLELYPKTGRTHQLRVHASYIGHPIVGDRMYGGGPVYRSQLQGHAQRAEGPLITRQALHAHTIGFRHPRTGEDMELEAPWPEDFTTTLETLRELGAGV